MKVFGKVAKGVGGAVWGPDRGALALPQGCPSAAQLLCCIPEVAGYIAGQGEEDLEVEKYLGRISDGILAEDRLEALLQLRDLLQSSTGVCMRGFL